MCIEWGAELGLTVSTFQSNHEGAIIDRIQAAAADSDGIVINAGAFTHYSYAIYDALVAVALPTVEVHISDIHAREDWRRRSVIQPACLAQISGEGVDGYRRALTILAEGRLGDEGSARPGAAFEPGSRPSRSQLAAQPVLTSHREGHSCS